MTTSFPQEHLEAVLFDLDGTLIDTNELILASFSHVLREYLGKTVSRPELVQYFGEPLVNTLGRFAPPERVPDLVQAYRAFNLEHHDQLTRPVPGMREVLERLRSAGIRLAVTTSKMDETAWRGLRLFNLEGSFEVVVGAGQTRRHKPHPDPVLYTLERLGLSPGPRVLMVGDTPHDLDSGRAAGVQTAAVAWSIIPRDVLAACAPDFWLETPADLLRLCLGPESEPQGNS